MRPRIVFAVMSAVAPAALVDQLAHALMPHVVLVHHDFTQTPDFHLSAPNVCFVPQPRRTGWASFGFVEGIFHTLAWAHRELEFDYLQLLSPSCLPTRPMAQFEAHVCGPAEAHFDCIDLLADPDCLMSVGYRAFTPADSLRHRLLRRLTRGYFDNTTARRDEAGVWLHGGQGVGVQAVLARWAIRAFAQPWLGRHPFAPDFRPWYGSTWFGAKPHIVQGLVEGFHRPGLREYFSRVRISEEFLVPTLLMQLVRAKGTMNHHISRFEQAHPRRLAEGDISQLADLPTYFARKFPDDPEAPVRLRVLRALAQVEPRLPAQLSPHQNWATTALPARPAREPGPPQQAPVSGSRPRPGLAG